VDAPPAKKPVRTHRVAVTDGVVHVALSGEAPDLPPGPGIPTNDAKRG
jgi:3-phenylpropionate/trans-cinnamate dioxygenase ferredoxin subunit